MPRFRWSSEDGSGVRRDALLLSLLSGAVFFFQLGAVRLWDVDEAIFAETAREMFVEADPVAPCYNGALFTHKPPWLYWGMMAGYRVFGCNEFAARCGSALAGLATVLITYALGRRLFGARVGFWGGMILGSCLQFALIARAATPDAWLTLFSTLGMTLLARGIFVRGAIAGGADGSGAAREPGRTASGATYALAYAAFGFGVLAKGPVALVLPAACWAAFLIVRDALLGGAAAPIGNGAAASEPRRARLAALAAFAAPGRWWRAALEMRPALALLVPLAVAGPWYALVGWRTHGEWLVGFFGVHNFGRFMQPMENHGGPVVYYLIALLVGLFPWSIFLSPTCLQAARSVATRPGKGNHATGNAAANSATAQATLDQEFAWQGDLLLICWLGVWTIFFSLAGTKLPSYIAPAYPAAALLLARFVVSWLEAPASVARFWIRSAFAVLGAVGLTTAIALPWAIEHYLSHAWELHWGLLATPLLAAAVAGWIFSERGQATRAAWSVALGSVLFLCGVMGLGAARVDDFQYTAPMAARILEESRGAEPTIVSFHHSRPSLVFYTRHVIDEAPTAAAAAAAFAGRPGPTFLVVPEAEYESVRPLLPADVRVLGEYASFLRSHRLMLLGRASPGAERTAARATDCGGEAADHR